jgi:hypothetical protein
MEQELTVEDVLAMVEEKAKEVDEIKVYYSLRKMRLRHLKSATVKAVKYAVALTELGLPITTSIMTPLLKKVDVSVLTQLHNLGDRHILVLKRSELGGCYEWALSPVFRQHYYESAGEENRNVTSATTHSDAPDEAETAKALEKPRAHVLECDVHALQGSC